MKVPQFLLVLLGTALSASAASTVLYETGWEASPAMPAWVPGNLIGQNVGKWAASPATANDRNRVVANGTADANPFGAPVATAKT